MPLEHSFAAELTSFLQFETHALFRGDPTPTQEQTTNTAPTHTCVSMMLMLLARGNWITLTTGPLRSRFIAEAGVSTLVVCFTCAKQGSIYCWWAQLSKQLVCVKSSSCCCWRLDKGKSSSSLYTTSDGIGTATRNAAVANTSAGAP